MVWFPRYLFHCMRRMQAAEGYGETLYDQIQEVGGFLQRKGLTPKMAARVTVHYLHHKLYGDKPLAELLDCEMPVTFTNEFDVEALTLAMDLGLVEAA